MSQLNLLPWRDSHREEINRQVRNIAIGVAIAMAGLVYWGYYYMNTQIDFQKERNAKHIITRAVGVVEATDQQHRAFIIDG